MEQTVIEVNNLYKRYKNFNAVDGISFSVNKGDVFGFLGPNGAGKSTTIRMIMTLIKPNSGNIKLFNKDLNSNRNDILKNVGAIVEKPDFYDYLSAFRNLDILAKMSGKEISRNRIMEVLELVSLDQRYNSKVKTFSHGMKQRLGIAQSLLHNPELIILDEPTTGLDPQGMKEIRDLILYLSGVEGKTIFLSSHLLSEVELVANRMIIINKGKVKADGYVQDLLNKSSMKVKITVDNSEKFYSLIKDSQWINSYVSKLDDFLIFNMTHDLIPDLIKYAVDNKINIFSIVPTRSLEEYFLNITENGD